MKYLHALIWTLIVACSCGRKDQPIVDRQAVDSLISHYSPSALARTNAGNLAFWKHRMDSLPDNFVNAPEYASALALRFHLYGDIHDLLSADSLMKATNAANQEKEPGIFRTLASMSMLMHRFQPADSFLTRAIALDGQNIPNSFLDFDVSFERGRYKRAKSLLPSLQSGNNYGYLFRRSKLEHFDGSLDSAIACMLGAAEKAGNNKYLKQVAFSNAADLYIHNGNLQKAADLYWQSIRIDAADLHSITGLGWIAMVKDKNDSLAEKIFQFVRAHSHAPDALLKLEQLAASKNDTVLAKKYAQEFVAQAAAPVYGMMYNKYLIGLYTGILNEPAKAVALARDEIDARPTAQVFAWYAWSLFCNNQRDTAYMIFKNYVSGRPLEALELFYMGKLMQGLDKGYNAKQFFEAALKNEYDLSPAQVEEAKTRY